MNDPTCLVADDHPALTSAVSSYLADNGFEIVGPAPDGRRAPDILAQLAADARRQEIIDERPFGGAERGAQRDREDCEQTREGFHAERGERTSGADFLARDGIARPRAGARFTSAGGR